MTAVDTSPLLVVSALLRYPDPALRTAEIPEFHEEVRRVSPSGLQELYTITFDLNPVATLEVGWHLWGEQYERGRFLADLRGRQDLLGVDAGSELPDHLPVLLEMLDREFDHDLAQKVLAAVDKIVKPLDDQGNPYRHVLHAAKDAVRARLPSQPGSHPQPLPDGAPGTQPTAPVAGGAQ